MFPQVYDVVAPVVHVALSDDGDMDIDSSSLDGASSKTMSAQTCCRLENAAC